MATHELVVNCYNSQKLQTIDFKQVKILTCSVMNIESKEFNEVAVHFVTENEICKMHSKFFDDPSPTDTISFPIDHDEDIGYRVLGDVFVCPKVAIDYVKAYGGNSYEETSIYVIHGLLHLLGYDDTKEKNREIMKKREKLIFSQLKKEGKLLSTH